MTLCAGAPKYLAKHFAAVCGVASLCLLADSARAQETAGSDAARLAGGALGLYSVALLGTVGALIPCSQTYAGAKCVRAAAVTAGVIGFAGGFYLGDADEDRVASSARGAGYGLLIGSLAGFGLKQFVPRFSWADVATGGLIGSAIGASAKGAGIGLAAGSVVGLVLWQSVPAFDLPNAAGVALLGMAVGGIGSWVVRSVDAQSNGTSVPPVVITVPFDLKL